QQLFPQADKYPVEYKYSHVQFHRIFYRIDIHLRSLFEAFSKCTFHLPINYSLNPAHSNTKVPLVLYDYLKTFHFLLYKIKVPLPYIYAKMAFSLCFVHVNTIVVKLGAKSLKASYFWKFFQTAVFTQ